MAKTKYPHLKELFYQDRNAYMREWRRLNPERYAAKDKWRQLTHHNELPDDAVEIPYYPTYYARPNGEIWRDTSDEPSAVKRGKNYIIKLKDRYNPLCNYHQVQPYQNGKRKVCYVHRLVLSAFTGQVPQGMEVNHIDGNTSNNCVTNLEWVTRQENINHAHKRGSFTNRTYKTYATGRKQSEAKWTAFRPEILKMYQERYKPKEIAAKLGMPLSTVYNYVRDFNLNLRPQHF